MYQSQVRPNQGGRTLVAQQQQPKQHSFRPLSHRGATPTFLSFLQFFPFQKGAFRLAALALVTAGMLISLSACGVNYHGMGTISSGSGNGSSSALSEISCGTTTLTGAQSKTCSVYLSAAASSPTKVSLSSSNSALQVPSAVTIAAGAESAGFDAVSSAVNKTTNVTITASADGVTKTEVITLDPKTTTTSASLSSVSCGTQSLTGSESKACTVTLSAAASSAIKVSLSSNNSALQVPSTMTIAEGAESGGFNVVASAVSKATSVTITASADGVSKTDVITLDPKTTATAASLSSIVCGTQSLTGSESSTCTASLSEAASSATSVTLTSNNAALQVPSAVTIVAGASSGSFKAVASAVSKATSVTITGSAGGVTKTDVLTLNPPTTTTAASLSSIVCGTQSLTGSQSSACTINLSKAASSAMNVTLSSNNAALQVPSGVTIVAGASSGSFKAVASAVSKATSVTITGSAGGVTKTDVLTLNPPTTTTAASLSSIACGTQSLTGSQSSACTINLSKAASSAVNVTLSSNNAALQVPSGVTIVAGASSGSFKAVASAVSKATSVTITGSAGGVTKTDVLTLNPPTTTTAASLSSISCGTQSLTGSQSKTCSVYLSAAASSATTVSLSSNNSALKVPSSVAIAAGANSASFSAVASAVSKTTSVTITGSNNGVSMTDVLTLYPPAAAPVGLVKLSCTTLTLLGPTTTACLVTLSGAATGSLQVALSSNNSALTVPSLVIVLPGLNTGAFVATASAVTTTQNATLTATSNGVSQTAVLQLDASEPAKQYTVSLNWNAPSSSPVSIAGYNIYRAIAGSSYQLMNFTVDANTSYSDNTVASGQTYDYIVKSVDTAGVESAPSNETTVSVP